MTDPKPSEAHTEILATLAVGDIVLVGDHLPMWTKCLLHVEEVRSWGVIGNVHGPDGACWLLHIRLENITTVFRERR